MSYRDGESMADSTSQRQAASILRGRYAAAVDADDEKDRPLTTSEVQAQLILKAGQGR